MNHLNGYDGSMDAPYAELQLQTQSISATVLNKARPYLRNELRAMATFDTVYCQTCRASLSHAVARNHRAFGHRMAGE